MSDVHNFAPQDWRELCQAALVELDPVKLPLRIALARSAILNRLEDGHLKSESEQQSLQDALSTLDSLRRITERQDGCQSKAS
jgi:hypothetical protein